MADKGLTYAEAGVDIDAGNRVVEPIRDRRDAGSLPARRL
jgi:phosphoribosylaminoimidazole (AIR) synthetase